MCHNGAMALDNSKTNLLIEVLKSRRLLSQVSAENLPNEIMVYTGFDPTSTSLHIGHLVVLRSLMLMKEYGCKTICIIGTGTALIGDPTWKEKTRPMLEPEAIFANAKSIAAQIESIAKPDMILYNHEWLEGLNILDFMREVASRFSVGQLTAMETFRDRLKNNQHLSFMEFTYPLLQAYDFLHLNRQYGCNAQFGGSDQWGNITQGIGFVKRFSNAEVYGMISDLLLTSSGQKMGKSVSGAVYLDPALVSPFDFWQFWRNIPDADLPRLLLQLTDTEQEKINELLEDVNSAKKYLADSITTMVHGANEATIARERGKSIFEQNSYTDLDTIKVNTGKLVQLLVDLQAAPSLAEAKRMINAGSVRLNNEKLTDNNFIINPGTHILQIGKKKFFKVEI